MCLASLPFLRLILAALNTLKLEKLDIANLALATATAKLCSRMTL